MPDQVKYRLDPSHYVHVLDNNTNVSRVEIGPQVLVRQEHEKIVQKKPLPMIAIPPFCYCVISNPVRIDDKTGEVVVDQFGQAKLHHGDKEYRFTREPFPLYPGETLQQGPSKMTAVLFNQALRLRALVDFEDENGTKRIAGSEWYFKGPGTYKPRKEVEELNIIYSQNIKKHYALLIEAVRDCVDIYGNNRVAGERWLIRESGDYLPSVDEQVVEDAEEEVKAVILNSKNYCTVLNPVDGSGKCQIGMKKIIRGPCSFFLNPGEKLDGGIKDVHQLTENDGLILRCVDTMEGCKIGDMWLLRGPTEFVPTEAIEIVHVRKAIALAENEGIYVKNINNGEVRAVIGGNYMLTEEEELWEKQLPAEVYDLLDDDLESVLERSLILKREKYRVVSYKVPHNTACKIYDYRLRKSRVIFGPQLALLQPDEQFIILRLSEGIPKKANARKVLCLPLGPDYFEEMFTIETADHARLSLRINLHWIFSINSEADEEKIRIFAIPDFIGDLCKVVTSRIRNAVSLVPFNDFHKNSSNTIHLAVFGKDDNDVVKESITFPLNYITITSLDIISLEPIDQKTREALQRTVQLAIEITTSTQEASAKQEAIRQKQEAEGRQIREKLIDSLAAEKERKQLIAQKVENTEMEACGQAVADAKSQAQASRIEKESAVEQAKLEVDALRIKTQNEIEHMKNARQIEIDYMKEVNTLELDKLQRQSDIELNKFKEQVASIGKETLVAVANAGPELKVKMLQALGLHSALITDGSNPINLFNTAAGLIDVIDRGAKIPRLGSNEKD
ncbi:hypothetical protein GJ496_006892 [Pomphorhynchus laevis]|nr:hypothetical protein GJ496_006892 [Pomphorhynchus laevis]